jgi:glycosyltransferase involved in cell wall biosynthesis
VTPNGANVDIPAASVKNIALIGSYVPRQCGIATFTKDLRDAIARDAGVQRATIIAMDDSPNTYPYPGEVAFQVRAPHRRDYFTAADLLNINRVDVAMVQHEYGIYGGADGEFILDFASSVRMPVIATLHTVLTEPSPGQARVVSDFAKRGNRLVVMSHLAKKILEERYNVRPDRVHYIPHGIPDVPFVDPAYYKDQFGFEGRTVLLTFGLLSPGKGIEVAIQALPKIVEACPNALYVVLGATHPHVLKRDGNAYRNSLERRIEKMGLSEHVIFHNRFVTLEELCAYIGAADIYITPYTNKAQITSGTLAYAMGAGKACISTPFWYAEEMLAEGRGRLFPFNDSSALADTVVELLSDEIERNSIRKRGYSYGRSMIWSEVAKGYLQVAQEAVEQARNKPRSFKSIRRRWDATSVPDAPLRHLQTLTDGVGMLQHAVCSVPDRNHGYCTDDNARALATTMKHHSLYGDEVSLELSNVYMSFLHYAFNPNHNRFRNFMSYDRQWLEDVGSEDCHARALWALATTIAHAPNEGVLSFATMLFHRALPACEEFTSIRAWATVLIGIHTYLQRFSGDTNARRMRELLSTRVYDHYTANASEDWPWPEDILAYDNARLSQALILSGQWLPHNDMLSAGFRSLEWLLRIQTIDGRLSLIGNCGWMKRNGERARFDQQPLDALALIEACAEAYRCTQNSYWLKQARLCFSWFLGNNDSQAIMCDHRTGGCSDGLHHDCASLNQGAESTLAWLLSVLAMEGLARPEPEQHDEMPVESKSEKVFVPS